MSTAPRDVPVLIVGGSLVGLSTALFLRRHGIDVLAVERHAGTAIHPRAGHFNLRTLEILRMVGLETQVRERGAEQYHPEGGINNVESLAGTEISHFIPNLNIGVGDFSPTVRCFVDQDALEPILREHAVALGADLRYRTELVSFEQDADGVTATIRDLESGDESTVRAQYMVAADGNRSPVRSRLGIEMRGHGHLSNSITIYFRADCTPLVEGRNQGVIYVTNPVLRGFFRLNRGAGSGFLVVNLIGDIARPEIVAQYPDAPWANVAEVVTPEYAEYLLRAAIGVPEFPVEVVDVATWRAVADSAERYGDGRVFLAGDAAHTVPPNGGYGGNTGIGDAWDISWKLAAVLNGDAGPALLDTYDAERRPLGEEIIEQAYGRYVTRVATYIGADGITPIVDDTWIELGPRYRSSAIADEGGDGAVLNDPATIGGRPGSRAPHVWLEVDGERRSTIDLFGRGWVLLAASDDWQAPAGVERHVVPADVAEAYGIGGAGASLVRPDGFVAWRAQAPDEDVDAVLARLLSR